jgi:6-phosphofructokinase 1
MGMAATEAVLRGERNRMVSLRGTALTTVPFAEALDQLKTVPPERYAEAAILFG